MKTEAARELTEPPNPLDRSLELLAQLLPGEALQLVQGNVRLPSRPSSMASTAPTANAIYGSIGAVIVLLT
jgi:hypothetical protein